MWKRLKLNDAVHVAVFGPTGSGKSAGVTIPHLLSTEDAAVIYSPKGDELKETIQHRRRLGPVYVLDPFGVSEVKSDALNPLAFMNPDSPTAVDDARDFGGVLVVKNPQLTEPFFEDSARVAVSAFTLAAVKMLDPHERTPASLRELLAGKWNEVLAAMQGSDDVALTNAGHSLAQLKDKTLSSVQATVTTHLAWIDSPAAAAATGRSTFDPWEAFKKRSTIFILIPPSRLQQQIPLLRAWLHVLMLAASAGGTRSGRAIRFIVEEAAQLGPLDILDKALSVGRGYGLRLLLLYQTVSQLKRCFPDGQDQTVLSNVSQLFINTNDYQTADYISSRLGDQTVVTHSGGSTHGRSGQSQPNHGNTAGYSTSDASNWGLHGRRLLQPSEVLALEERQAVVFVPGKKPILTWIDRYYEHAREGVGPVKACIWTFALFLVAVTLAIFVATYQPPPPRYPPVAIPPQETFDGQAVTPVDEESRPAGATATEPSPALPGPLPIRRGSFGGQRGVPTGPRR